MCKMADDQGGDHAKERSLLDSIADMMGISRSFICQSLESCKDLD
jgi:hypothetical protein